MKLKKKSILFTSLIIVASLLLTACGNTQSSANSGNKAQEVKYPTKPVKIVVPLGAGGTADLIARALAKGFQDQTGQPLIVENYPTGAGIPAITTLIKEKPDGYSLLLTGSAKLDLLPLLHKVNYSFPEYFTPIIGVAATQDVYAVKKDAPYNTVSEMVKYFKDKSQEVRVGTSGMETDSYYEASMVADKTGIKIRPMPFDSNNQVVTNLLGGHLDLAVVTLSTVYDQMKSGNIKLLGVPAAKRYDNLPDVPTLTEEGIDVTSVGSFDIYGPANLPKDIADKLRDVFLKSMQTDQFKSYATNSDLSLTKLSADDLAKEISFGKQQYESMIKK
ncbi:tripartite tricarboxylate transporter substrate binding protein [Desulfosporosinus sp. SB140]|uniref:tripartite tricarboxylate transporter substrate binding protein n=1 Tax=Desulfosporosinus paludis TaxID=3115649 RepID=UPI00389102B5